jgi:N-acetylmuramoyl-L-alanine amidase
MIDTDKFSDEEILARTIYGEARNQPYIGQQAIACVVMNRVKHAGWWGNSVRTVCLDPYQFDCWMPKDPNRAVIMDVKDTDPVFANCLEIAHEAMTGELPDCTDGADSYLVNGLVKNWNRNLTPVAIIGKHSFYATV